MTSLGYIPLSELDYSLMELDKQIAELRKLLGELTMKQCRFCDADIPYYGPEDCLTCRIEADRIVLANKRANTQAECAREDLDNNL